METWVLFTLLAAFMQAIRTAGQKILAKRISSMATTLVRYLFGLPFAVVYLVLITPKEFVDIFVQSIGNPTFLIYASLASIAQILASVWLIMVLHSRNFAVGTSFAKTEAIQTAILGAVFFAEYLSGLGWLAVTIGVLGILIVSLPQRGQGFDKKSLVFGMLSGIAFSLTSLWLRQASLSLGFDFVESAAITLVYMVSMQTFVCLIYIVIRESNQLVQMKKQLPLATFVGATSAFGSIGWFTAMTYENAALVKSLGKIEFIFTLLITYFFFGEKISIREYVGMLAILLSVLILLLLA